MNRLITLFYLFLLSFQLFGQVPRNQVTLGANLGLSGLIQAADDLSWGYLGDFSDAAQTGFGFSDKTNLPSFGINYARSVLPGVQIGLSINYVPALESYALYYHDTLNYYSLDSFIVRKNTFDVSLFGRAYFFTEEQKGPYIAVNAGAFFTRAGILPVYTTYYNSGGANYTYTTEVKPVTTANYSNYYIGLSIGASYPVMRHGVIDFGFRFTYFQGKTTGITQSSGDYYNDDKPYTREQVTQDLKELNSYSIRHYHWLETYLRYGIQW